MIHHAVSRAIVPGAKMVFSNGQADGIRESLSERAGCGLHARCQPAFRMPRTLAAPLAKLFDLFQGQIVTGQMQQTVEQHRTVPG